MANVEASGDCRKVIARCRLCDGCEQLRSFSDSCSWNNDITYAQLLCDCFDVEVKSLDWLLCEECAVKLRNAGRLKASVQAALDNTLTEATSNQSTKTLKLLNIPTERPLKQNVNVKRKSARKTQQCERYKRKYLFCTVCGQKYFMLVNLDENNAFVCSRCKKEGGRTSYCKRCNGLIPSNLMKEHLEMHAQSDLKGKSRLRIQNKTAQIRSGNTQRVHQKYECLQCLKRHKDIHEYLNHMKVVHKVYTICKICGKDLKTKYFLDKHLLTHKEDACQNKMASIRKAREYFSN